MAFALSPAWRVIALSYMTIKFPTFLCLCARLIWILDTLTLSTSLIYFIYLALTEQSTFLYWCSLTLLGTYYLPQLLSAYFKCLPCFSGIHVIYFTCLTLTLSILLTCLTYLAPTFCCWCSLALLGVRLRYLACS